MEFDSDTVVLFKQHHRIRTFQFGHNNNTTNAIKYNEIEGTPRVWTTRVAIVKKGACFGHVSQFERRSQDDA